ncbi:MAG: heterodisulfide reductase-related iron-sulfur binding cluster [Candidatus Helarchaeota archaeon]
MRFIQEKCTRCGECLYKCNYLDLDLEEAKKEIINLIDLGDSFILSECVTCYACNEYCKENANPFDLIASLQEINNTFNIDKNLLKMLEKQYEPYEFTLNLENKGPLMSQCAFFKSHSKLFKGDLFENLTLIGGRSVFCNLIYLHTGQYSLIEKRAPLIVENVKKALKNFISKELICFHDECYLFFQKFAPAFGIDVPFKPIHLYEYLVRYLQKNKEKVNLLKMKIAFQRSCSTRLTPEKDDFLDEIFRLIGVERVKRKFDYENAMCCQAPLLGFLNKKELAIENQNKNIKDALDNGAEAMIFICPMCYDTLKAQCEKNGLIPLFITDLCRIALGELSIS